MNMLQLLFCYAGQMGAPGCVISLAVHLLHPSAECVHRACPRQNHSNASEGGICYTCDIEIITCEPTVAHTAWLTIACCTRAMHATLLASKCGLHDQHADVTCQPRTSPGKQLSCTCTQLALPRTA